MSIDWSKSYKGAMRGTRGKFGSYAEMLQDQHQKQEEVKKGQEAYRKLEPLLRKSLLEHMTSRSPLRVTGHFEYYTEELVKSSDGSGSFRIAKAVIPMGTELTYSHWDKTMGQWVFKSQDGAEYEIFDTPQVQLPGGVGGSSMVPNPGFYGLLTRTHIYQALVQATAENE